MEEAITFVHLFDQVASPAMGAEIGRLAPGHEPAVQAEAGARVAGTPRNGAHAGSAGSEDARKREQPTDEAPISLYFREINRVELLSGTEEVRLAREIEDAKVAAQRLKTEQALDAQEQARLEQVIERGQSARWHLIEANLRLVVSVAKRYLGRGVPLLDLIQEGNIGLYRAVDKFDWHRGFKFSTYAHWWIRQAITRAVAEQSRTVRLPLHVLDQVGELYRAARRLDQLLGREPTVADLADALGVSVEKVAQTLSALHQPLSLDLMVGEDEESSLADLIPESDAVSPADAVADRLLSQHVEDAISALAPREQLVLRCRFGLSGERSRTLEEIGSELGVTRERVRQIEARALRKLRSPDLRSRLAEYLD